MRPQKTLPLVVTAITSRGMEVDLKQNSSYGGKDLTAKARPVDRCGLNSNCSPDNNCSENQPKKTWRLSLSEWLGIIIMAMLTLWVSGAPPSNPREWFHWFFHESFDGVHTPMWTSYLFLVFTYILVTRVARRHKWKTLKDFFPGSMAVSGVSILTMDQDSIAAGAGMQRGDVIIEYGLEKDLTLEKLAAVMAKKEAASGPVAVIFVRDRRQYSCTLPPGPLGISAVNATVDVLVKSE